MAVLSARVDGRVSEDIQRMNNPTGILRTRRLSFVCVWLNYKVWEEVGGLDERFTGYGGEDWDYCEKVIAHGYELAVASMCTVDHTGHEAYSCYLAKQSPQTGP